MSSNYGSEDVAGEEAQNGMTSSLSSLLNLDQGRQEATRTILKYDISSHIASLAHTSHLAHQRSSALSQLAQEKNKAAKITSLNFRLAAAVAVRNARLRIHDAKAGDLKVFLGPEVGSGVGADVVMELCGSKIRDLLEECRKGKNQLGKMKEKESQLRRDTIQLERQVTQIAKAKRETCDELSRVKSELNVVIDSKNEMVEKAKELEEELVRQGQNLEDSRVKIQNMEQLRLTMEHQHLKEQQNYESQLSELKSQLARSESHARTLSTMHFEAEQFHEQTRSLLESVRQELHSLWETENQLRADLQQQQKTHFDLEGRERSLVDQLTEMKKTLDENTKSKQQIKAELENEKIQTIALMRTATDLRAHLKDYQEVVARLETRIEDLENNLSTARSQGQDTSNTVFSLRAKLEETVSVLENARSVHQQQISSLIESDTSLKESLKSIMAENDKLKENAQQNSKEMVALNDEIEDLRTKNLSLASNLDNSTKRESILLSERDLSNKKHAEILEKQNTFQQNVQYLELQILSLKAEKTTADERIVRLMEKAKHNEALKRNYDLTLKSLRSKVEHLRSTKKTIFIRLREAQAHAKVITSQHESMKEELARSQVAYLEIQAANFTSASELAGYRNAKTKEIENLQAEMEELKKQQIFYDEEVQNLRHSSTSDKEELCRLQNAVQNHESKQAELEAEKRDLLSQLERQKALIQSHEKTIREKNSDIAKLKEEHQTQIVDLQAVISSGKRELDELRAKLASKISELQSSMSSNTAELTRTQKTLDEREMHIKHLERQLRHQSLTIAETSKRSSVNSEDQAQALTLQFDDSSDISATSSGSASHSNLTALAALATETQSLRRTAGRQVQRIASLEEKLQSKDMTLSELRRQIQSRDQTLSKFSFNFQQLQQQVSERDKQLSILKSKAKKQDDEVSYWRRIAEERDLSILELEGFQQQLRQQLFHTGRRKSKQDLITFGAPERPVSRLRNSRMLSDSVTEMDRPNSLASRLQNVRLSSMTHEHFGLSPAQEPQDQAGKIDSSPVSSRGGYSTLSDARTRVPSSHSMKALLASGLSRSKSGKKTDLVPQATLNSNAMEEKQRSALQDEGKRMVLKERKPSLLYKLSHMSSSKRR